MEARGGGGGGPPTLPGTLWGSVAGWCGPPSSGSPALPSAPIAGSPPARCPSAGPSGCPAPRPAADSGRADRGGPAPAPPRGSAAGLSSAGCERRRPSAGSFQRSLQTNTGEKCEEMRRRQTSDVAPVTLWLYIFSLPQVRVFSLRRAEGSAAISLRRFTTAANGFSEE